MLSLQMACARSFAACGRGHQVRDPAAQKGQPHVTAPALQEQQEKSSFKGWKTFLEEKNIFSEFLALLCFINWTENVRVEK